MSSPGDVPEERRRAGHVVARLAKDPAFRGRLSLDVILWDDPEAATAMLATRAPQENVNELVRPSQCEVVVTILWSRMGTPLETPLTPDGTRYLSGTEWEFEDGCREAKRFGRRVLLYRCTRKPQVELDDPALAEKQRQFGLVKEFFARFTGTSGGAVGSYTSYESPGDFESRLESDLRQILPAFIEQRPERPASPRSSRSKATVPAASARPTRPVVPDAYRDWIVKETGSLELLGLGGSQGRSFVLSSVYVPLVTHPGERAASGAELEVEREPGLLLRALGERSLYVSGGPGSGKSTFCRWVALLVVGGAIPQADVALPAELTESLPEPLLKKLPVLVPLREFWGMLPKKPAGSSLSASELMAALDEWLKQRTDTACDVDLPAFIEAGSVVLLFDGADEVPTTDASTQIDGNPRRLLLAGVTQAVKRWTPKGNILLLTSRPFGLTAEEVNRVGLAAAPIADLPSDLQKLLARRWFRIQKQDITKGDASAEDLTRDIEDREWLRPLAANPLMLTAMCAIYSDGAKLPQDRHQLYDRIVDSVLTKRYDDPKRRARARFELCAIAHAMHTGEGLGVQHSEPLAQATLDEAELALRKDEAAASHKESVLKPREALDDLLTRSGLLTSRGDRTLAFYHLSIQEFMAAERVFELRIEDLKSVIIERSRIAAWRNTVSFLFGRYMAAFTAPTRPLALTETLIDELPGHDFLQEIVIGDCAEMLLAKGYALDHAAAGRLRQRLLSSMATRHLAAERCEAGTMLGKIGDPRFLDDCWFLANEPDAPLGFVAVPAGVFRMGSDSTSAEFSEEQPQHDVRLSEFFIGKYPVTVAQFRAFVETTGFVLEDTSCLRGVPNHPVVFVSWHEALNYCDWLTEVLQSWTDAPHDVAMWLQQTVWNGWRVTLPSEAEWEKAARGVDGRIYPWGDTFDPAFANVSETGIQRTSAVGAFPGGASPVNTLDMCGNVWEWTRSLASKEGAPYPYRQNDLGREDLSGADAVARGVRGGGFGSNSKYARCARRGDAQPAIRSRSLGFRVVVACARS